MTQTGNATSLSAGELSIHPVKLSKPCQAGTLDISNANYVLACLDAAVDACKTNQCQALVTGPVQKSVINDAGMAFSGHTEYLAQKTSTDTVVMMLATEDMRVALATTHLPLREVSDAISRDLLYSVIKILHHDLKTKFAIQQPTILVCGLNPHAGEDGHLGQ